MILIKRPRGRPVPEESYKKVKAALISAYPVALSLYVLLRSTRISLAGLKKVLAYYHEKGQVVKIQTTSGIFWKWYRKE